MHSPPLQITPATSGPALNKDSVHVWVIPIPTDPDTPIGNPDVLSAEEAARAARFVFAKDRLLYTTAHVALRCILADYLHVAPVSLTFETAERGKPSLAGPAADSLLRFNLSHTRGLALCALALDREVGVDVEALERAVDVMGVARRMFSPAEQQVLREHPLGERHAAFFRVWTRKEALVKAIGQGLDDNTGEFTVSASDSDNNALLSSALAWLDIGAWRIQSLHCAAGFHGAVAASGHDPWSVRMFSWAPPPN